MNGDRGIWKVKNRGPLPVSVGSKIVTIGHDWGFISEGLFLESRIFPRIKDDSFKQFY